MSYDRMAALASSRHDAFLRCVMRNVLPLLVLACFSVLPCIAEQAPTPKVVDITASDGTVLKATYFAAANPGPGVLLLHQCNRQRKVWDDLARGMTAQGINV